jgi:hypothetical protein
VVEREDKPRVVLASSIVAVSEFGDKPRVLAAPTTIAEIGRDEQ